MENLLKVDKKGTGFSASLKRHGFIKEIKTNYIMFLMLVPALLYYVLFHYTPMVGVLLAFKRYTYSAGFLGSEWVGFENFRFLFLSGTVWNITKNTILYNIAFLSVSIFSQVAIAILISEITSKWFRKISQSLLFLPYFVSYVLLAAFVYNLFGYEHGTVNTILHLFGQKPINVYENAGAWKYILLIFNEWKGIGYGTVIYLATIAGISKEYYEAAAIDSATRWQQIKTITLPMLKPTIIIITLFALGNIMRGQFQLFYQVIGNNGQLYQATDIIDTYVFRMLTKNFDVGMGAAAGLYQSFFGLVIIVAVNTIIKRVDEENALF